MSPRGKGLVEIPLIGEQYITSISRFQYKQIFHKGIEEVSREGHRDYSEYEIVGSIIIFNSFIPQPI
jgi:hypothetical protein